MRFSEGGFSAFLPVRNSWQDGDKFFVLASDGVWEFISSKQAIDIVNAALEQGTMKVGRAE